MNAVLESFVVSIGILLVGIFTIPLAGKACGVRITRKQAFGMSLLFFAGRWLWVYLVREFSILIGSS